MAQGTSSFLRQSMSTDANAPGARPTLGHLKGWDGIRAFAVLSIIAFHTGLNSVPGGFYGVDAFFVLSGFLITSLLVKEWGGTRARAIAALTPAWYAKRVWGTPNLTRAGPMGGNHWFAAPWRRTSTPWRTSWPRRSGTTRWPAT